MKKSCLITVDGLFIINYNILKLGDRLINPNTKKLTLSLNFTILFLQKY